MSTNHLLALANVTLIANSGVCMAVARRAIRAGKARRHGRLMQTAVALQALFLVSFVTRFALFGPTPFRGGQLGHIGFSILLYSHEPLSVVCVPLVLVTLALGWSGQLRSHRELAPWTYALWLYSVVTGIVIYFVLY